MPRVMDMDSLPPEIPQTLWFDRLVEDMGNLTTKRMPVLYYVHVNMSMLNTHSAAASRSSITPPSTRGSSDGGVSDHTGFI